MDENQWLVGMSKYVSIQNPFMESGKNKVIFQICIYEASDFMQKYQKP